MSLLYATDIFLFEKDKKNG